MICTATRARDVQAQTGMNLYMKNVLSKIEVDKEEGATTSVETTRACAPGPFDQL